MFGNRPFYFLKDDHVREETDELRNVTRVVLYIISGFTVSLRICIIELDNL